MNGLFIVQFKTTLLLNTTITIVDRVKMKPQTYRINRFVSLRRAFLNKWGVF